ncbi:sensor histidine kinase [Streptomyces sp. H39-S7]|uniref:sensor histidine kinase n=1 Tax=Streptomyces sp. H39-S7 TaxID=3004357 RepID=UPI0022AF17E7|nr:HAMP domain-containing sensor histidine kinase [Streptomyces sp. H39-S7]MCZ4126128.1 HAMP domain-containing sensor histidine kinase [Streptomyces sp. H39-S7]
MRLTLLYTSLFLVSGTVLLTIAWLVVFRQPILATFAPDAPPTPPDMIIAAQLPGTPLPPNVRGVDMLVTPTSHTVRAVFVQSLAVLALMAVMSTALGWVVAGRVLAPLRTMAAKTRRISERNLHERLSPPGPQDEMSELAHTIDALLARLEQAFEAQRQFVANASHELRTPLAMMRTSVDVAVGKPQPANEVKVLAGKLREGLDAADRLLEGLLLLARAQNNGRTEVLAVVLSVLAASALDARADAIAEKNLTVERRLDLATVQGNAMLVTSLVENLVDNAVRHNTTDGWMRVTTTTIPAGLGRWAAGGQARSRLFVESSGDVLDQRSVDLLGQPFLRLGTERTSRPGTGLGLSIVKAIATAHHGQLTLHARAEGGLRAEVRL